MLYKVNTDGTIASAYAAYATIPFSFFMLEFGGKKAREEYSIYQGQLLEGELLDLRLSSIFAQEYPLCLSPHLSLSFILLLNALYFISLIH